jgi:hypothetical protein
MTTITAMRRRSARSILGFLTGSPDHRGAAVLAAVGLGLFVAACDAKPLTTSTPDAAHPTNTCATRACSEAPLCGESCADPCGCCPCVVGTRKGPLVCAVAGCYAEAPAGDGGPDAPDAPDGGSVCSLPFVAGPCEAAIGVYAFVDGAGVQRTYGGCMGNGTRCATLEECLATCAGGQTGECPPDRVSREICLSCGLAGGCAKKATTCALVCDPDAGSAACADVGLSCYQGVCQAAFCI